MIHIIKPVNCKVTSRSKISLPIARTTWPPTYTPDKYNVCTFLSVRTAQKREKKREKKKKKKKRDKDKKDFINYKCV